MKLMNGVGMNEKDVENLHEFFEGECVGSYMLVCLCCF